MTVRSFILALTLGVSLVAVAGAPPAAQSPDAAASSVTSGPLLLQLNFCGGSDCAGTDAQKVAAVVNVVVAQKPDVVSLNELCAQQLDALITSLRRRGEPMAHAFAATFPAGHGRCGGRAFGNAVLSRTAISSKQVTVYASQAPGLEDRALLCVRTGIGVDARVCSTHLVPGNRDAETRSRQIAQAAQVLAASARPTVLMGDLNEYPAADSLDLLYASRYGGGAHGTFFEGGSTRGGRPCRCGTATRSGVKLD